MNGDKNNKTDTTLEVSQPIISNLKSSKSLSKTSELLRPTVITADGHKLPTGCVRAPQLFYEYETEYRPA